MPSPMEVSFEKSLIVQKITDQGGLSINGRTLDYKTCVVMMKDERPYIVIHQLDYAALTAEKFAYFAGIGITFQTERLVAS